LTERFGFTERKMIRRKASLIAMLMLITFAITGTGIFRIFGITMPAFQIGGGILLLSFGLSQLNTTRARVSDSEQDEGLHKDDISIFPLATPLLAGPGAISTVVLYSSKAESALRLVSLIFAIGVVMLSSHLVLKVAPIIYRLLGKTGLNLLTRIMGIIVTAIGVQFIISGIRAAFNLGV
jgi:multiple antibiotic resistance protein